MANYLPFQTTYYLNRHSFIEIELCQLDLLSSKGKARERTGQYERTARMSDKVTISVIGSPGLASKPSAR